MKDPTPSVESLYHDMLMSRSPAERVRMACSMNASARAIIRAGIPDDSWETEIDLRIEIFRRFYRADFTEAEMEPIVAKIRAHAEKRRIED